MQNTLPVIGRNTLVSLGDIIDIPAKVDTGADSSSLWATNIVEKEGTLHFTVFGPGHSQFSGKSVSTTDYETTTVVSSDGNKQIRYVAYLPAEVHGVHYPRLRVTLADRSKLTYPMLLGRKALSGTFLVDTAREIAASIQDALKLEKKQRVNKKA